MGTHSLKITKVYKAPPEKVFNAWADKKQMLKWMGPGDVKCEKIEIDFKVGGKYQIFMLTPDGPMTAYGEYLEIDPPKKLSFTWGWRQNDLDGSIVTLTFKEMDGSTERWNTPISPPRMSPNITRWAGPPSPTSSAGSSKRNSRLSTRQ